MLTKRAQILFDESVWETLYQLSKGRGTSVANLIREAVREKYNHKIDLEQRRKAIDSTLKHRPKPFKGKIDYKELINAGRKY